MNDEDEDRMTTTANAAAVNEATEAWFRTKERQDATWDDWVLIGKGLEAGRTEVMRKSKSNSARGAGFTKPFGVWLKDHGLDDIDPGVRSRLLDCIDQLPAIEQWRATLTDSERRKYNHPNTVFRKFGAKPRSGSGGKRRTAKEVEQEYQSLLAEKDAEIVRLRQSGDAGFDDTATTPSADSDRWKVLADLCADLKQQAVTPPPGCEASRVKEALQRVLKALKPEGNNHGGGEQN